MRDMAQQREIALNILDSAPGGVSNIQHVMEWQAANGHGLLLIVERAPEQFDLAMVTPSELQNKTHPDDAKIPNHENMLRLVNHPEYPLGIAVCLSNLDGGDYATWVSVTRR